MRFHTMKGMVVWGAGLVLLVGLVGSSSVLAVDNSYVPASGGLWSTAGNWSLGHCPTSTETPVIVAGSTANKIVTYTSTAGITYPGVRVDGHSSGYYGMILQTQNVLTTTDMYLGTNGAGWYWLEEPAYTWVNNTMYIGYQGSGSGHFYMATGGDFSSGLYVGDLCYVGYGSAGDFDHTFGIAQIGRLYVGQNDSGYYHLRGGLLEVASQIVIGNGAAGTVEQTGAAFDQLGTNGLIMGLNTGGVGTYLMKGGELDVDHISLAWNGDAYFTQSGGTVTTVGDITIGFSGTHPMQAWYKLNQDDGTAVLNVGDDLLVGVQTYGKYEQNAGTCNVAGNVEIWKGSTTSTSAVYLGTSAGLLDVDGEVINHTGYYSQLGGVMTTSSFTNDSTQGVYLGNAGDFRATNLDHNAGTFQMYNTSNLRGQLVIPPSTFFMCNFTNDATFQMGAVAAAGGTFTGHLTNNGTFNYYQGTFSGSTLTNYGTVNLNNNFTCNRLVNHASMTIPTDRWVNAAGAGYANGVENDGNLTMYPRAHFNVGSNKIVNNGAMYAGGPTADYAHIAGNFENNDYLLPSASHLPAGGFLYVNGNFTSTSGAQLRIRLRGTATAEYDHMTVQNAATLAGTLDVRLTDGFVPSIGNIFYLMNYGSRTGQFSPVYLPTLPTDREWQLSYTATGVTLSVVAPAQDGACCFPDGSCQETTEPLCNGNFLGVGTYCEPNPCPQSDWCLGDMDCSGGAPTFLDISYFVAALNGEANWIAYYTAQQGSAPPCFWLMGDYSMPQDGVNFLDIVPFANSIGQPCVPYGT